MDSPWYTTAEAAALTRLSVHTVRDKARSGEIASTVIGGRKRMIHRDEIARYTGRPVRTAWQERLDQGLPATISDPEIISALAALVESVTRERRGAAVRAGHRTV